jgi:hypothetical protein
MTTALNYVRNCGSGRETDMISALSIYLDMCFMTAPTTSGAIHILVHPEPVGAPTNTDQAAAT